MSYKIKYSERNAKTAAEYEAKSLLHMIGKYKGSNKLSTIFIDCFNDITGTNDGMSELYDMQSKGVASLYPADIGAALATLCLNFFSDFPFSDFAILTPPLKAEYLISNGQTELRASDFKSQTLERIRAGLKNEIIRREPDLKGHSAIDAKIDAFLNMVRFVVDTITKSEYVKQIADVRNKDIKDERFYEAIFSDIKQRQSAKKLSSIHNAILDQVADALSFDRHIAVSEIFQLLAIRFAGADLFNSRGIPIPFLVEIAGKEVDEVADILLDCRSKISRCFFDKNKQSIFWSFLEKVLSEMASNPTAKPRDIYEATKNIKGLEYSDLNGNSGVYFISLIQEGLN